MADFLVPFALFGALVLVAGQFARLFSNISLNRTLREALRTDPSSVPILADRLDARQPWADELIGWIFIALAAGIVLTSLFEGADQRRDMLQAAIVPLLIGIVVIGYVQWARKKAGTTATPAARSRSARKPSRK